MEFADWDRFDINLRPTSSHLSEVSRENTTPTDGTLEDDGKAMLVDLELGASQILTPPISDEGHESASSSNSSATVTGPAPQPESSTTSVQQTVYVSTTFYPNAHESRPADAVFMSNDSVFFYINVQTIISASSNAFNGILTELPPPRKEDETPPVYQVPEESEVINVLLHAIYGLSCAHYSPSFEVLSTAVEAMGKYGLDVQPALSQQSPLHGILLSHAPTLPIELYALAGHYDAHDLAVSTSPHLLSYSLPSLTDELASRMGPVYLKKLFFLHLGRVEAFKRLLLAPPSTHAPTPTCDFIDQKNITRAWALAVAYLGWDARPDIATSTVEAALRPLAEKLECPPCRDAFNERIKTLIVNWSIVKRTI